MKTKSVSGTCCVPQKQSVGDADDDGARIPFADKASTNGMKKLPGGSFLMGSDSTEGFPTDGEGPVREVTVKPFYTDVGAVSNRQFNDFIIKKPGSAQTPIHTSGRSYFITTSVPRRESMSTIPSGGWNGGVK